MISKQEQTSGDNSYNIQARDVSIGISYSDAKLIAEDVFNANFYKLAGVAQETARKRADELLNNFLKGVSQQRPEALEGMSDPDLQFAVFTAQREYARSGDKELGDVLVDILIDRAGQSERSLLQIVLNESLTIAPKLTAEQFDVLSLIFLLRYTRKTDITDLPGFAQHLSAKPQELLCVS